MSGSAASLGACAVCAARLASLRNMALVKGVARGAKETGDGDWNHARLREFMVQNCYDGLGNVMFHNKCLANAFKNPTPLSKGLLARAHAAAIAYRDRGANFVQKGKLTKAMEKRVVVPSMYECDTDAYLLTLDDDAPVRLLALNVAHGNTGNEHAAAPYVQTRDAFRTYVMNNRSPTGRTADANGRLHGAAFYLSAEWTQIRKQGRPTDPGDD